MNPRREFLRRAAIGAALVGLPLARAEQAFAQDPPLPPLSLLERDAERFWAALRGQWLLARDRINLNCGSVGCSPLPVVRAMVDHIFEGESFRDPAYPWFGYEENARLKALREKLAAFISCSRDELALVRNATEANNVVANGLDMQPGEEVLMTDQEHPGGRCVWEQKAARHGTAVRFVEVPRPPASAGEIVERFERAIGPKTRVLMFSHITTVTGVVLPARELCAMARRRGILTHVDGAHCIGQLPLDLHAMGCDFYAASPHKWLMAPKGTGFLYVREEHLEKLWVNIASGDWRNFDLKAYRFSNFGTSNLSVMVGLAAALDFFDELGPARIYARQHELATRVRDRVRRYPQLRVANASADEFYGGMVSFEPAAAGDLSAVVRECAARGIRIAGGPERIRISTNIFTQPWELDAFFEALDAGLT
jgi:selenocysteine lyase/cysteine desulfurase